MVSLSAVSNCMVGTSDHITTALGVEEQVGNKYRPSLSESTTCDTLNEIADISAHIKTARLIGVATKKILIFNCTKLVYTITVH